jgi:hypothetical protein
MAGQIRGLGAKIMKLCTRNEKAKVREMTSARQNRAERGLGKWQRAILAELRKHPAFYLKDLLPEGYRRAEYVAALRAVSLLESRRLI